MRVITIEEHMLNPAVARASAAAMRQLNPYWAAAFFGCRSTSTRPCPTRATSADYEAGLDPIVAARFATAAWGWHSETGVHFVHSRQRRRGRLPAAGGSSR